ncbi:class B sortase [Anaerotruncus colihominis]|uniref:Class B sortase n=1 Tax=Anaerotruncus colihominis TaxID=169435 RepID=A0A845SVF3_9FIRM|nr:class B sortase [Anaerotruncus colihominis]MCR2026680.1 class B sortase [Anaerotruncus colihominis]NDO38292.1 class B sortase [Anaerotruncus colihominis]
MEKTTIHYRSGVKRLLAFLLCAVCVLGLIPTQAFAFSLGQKASSWLGDQYVGSDGQHYYASAPYTYLVYNSDGTMDVRSSSGGNAYRHYMLTASDGSSQQVYCVESGIAYNTSDNTYTSESGTNSNYLNLLPSEARRGITLTAIYGWKPGASLPVSGINEDDYKMATQIILWEYQQQLRSDPYSCHGNGHADANQYFSVIAGRPAEKAYNWILSQVASHSTVPSFTSTKKSGAPELELKWDTEKKVYTLTVTDTNNLKINLETLKGSGVSVTRNGNKYTFTSKNMIMNPVTFEFRKDIPVANDMLIWGRPGYQTMMTGASDPVSFFVKIKTETYGTAKIVKTSEDGIVSGIPFHISGTDILGNKVDETVTTGDNGQIKEKLLPGTYLMKELPVDRYVTPSAQYVTVESGQTASVHFSNILKKFRVHVIKSDADTGTAQGDATLAGATYGLFNNGDLVDTYTTGPDGSFMTRYYVCGDSWTVREIDPSTGYLLNDTVYEVGASPTLYEVELNTTENQITETVIYGNIQLVKHTDDLDPDVSEDENTDEPNEGVIERPEAGAVFEIYLKAAGSYDAAKESERDLLTTDGDGFASSKMLPYGRYTVHQAAGEEGKAFIPDFTVFISANGQTYSYILNNRTITARLKVEKCDAETGNIIPMTGTGFQIKDLSTGEFVTQEIYYPNPETLDTFYVSDEGWLMLPEPLHTGDYELYEVAAPYGYVLSSEPVPFTIDGSEAVVTVTQYNMPQKGKLTITKTGEVFASVQENDGLYQPVYEVMGLPGAVYDVIADGDIYTGDGTLHAAKDTVVETLTTGDDGTAQSGLLYLGCYRLEERQAPAGMVLNTQPEYVELTYAGETVEVTQTAVGLYDERQKVDVSLFKALETDELFGLGMNEEYKDISFGLYASADLTAVDGSVIPAGGLLEVVSVSANEAGGYDASFASDLPFGSYYVKERTTNSAYILSDTEYPVVFEYAGQDAALVQILVGEGEAVPNDLLRGRVDGVKYGENADGGEAVKLAGAVMGLFQPDTEEFTEENALFTVTTGEDGSFTFENIPYGHWIVKEISAPALYTVSPEEHHIYIGVDGQAIEIRVDDTLIRGRVQLHKTEAVDEPSSVESDKENTFLRFLSGAVFELYEDINGNKELDAEDTLVGTLKETDGGFHMAEGLLAKGYFVKESKAPEGYQLDENAYYFAITEDGQVAVVENGEAGRGFTNEAYRGNLKITKDSSDGRKDGFAFEVKNADGSYCETFTSPKSGVIEVKGLRVGIYTVTEISNRASRDYIIPDAATVEIKADETATVQFFNEKPEKPKTPDNPENPKTPSTPDSPSNPTVPSNPGNPGKAVPQTGDDNFIFLYGGLLALAVIGGGVFTVCRYRKGKYRKISPKAKAANIAILSLCAAVALGSGFLIVRDLNQYAESAGTYDGLAEHVGIPEQAAEPEEPGTEEETGREVSSVVLPVVDFEALRENGPDIIGWLNLPDTAINYPVTQTDDNEYYLHHLYDGTYNKVGCLFADYENQADFSDRNTIIYGHNMWDGSMFAALNEYGGQGYYDGHPQMYLVTPGGGYTVEIFTAFVAEPGESGSDASPWRLSWKDDGAYTTWLSEMAGRSVIETGVTVTSSDRVLTLSTCTPGGKSRFIVMGKLAAVND